MKIGFHASHEQFPPDELVSLAQAAEKAGFGAVMSSDHFHPWSPQQGQSGFVWSWLGAAMQATKLPFGTLSIPGGWRYHPAIVAQAAATLARMFPGRLAWLALGSGQALNEHITGERWPPKAERNARLKEAVEIIRALWAGETVTRSGLIRIEEATLYTRAEQPPQLFSAALTPATAEWAGAWADGLITVNQSPDKLKALVEAFQRGGGEGKPLALQVHVGWAGTDDEARRLAHEQWRANAVPPAVAEVLRTPEEFDAATQSLRLEDIDNHVLISSEPQRHVDWLHGFAELGFEEIYLHNTGPNQRPFIETFGEKVLPAFGDASS